MLEPVQLNSMVLAAIGALLSILLAVIAYFLDRQIKQIEQIGQKFDAIATTVSEIKMELGIDVSNLKIKVDAVNKELVDLSHVWDRLRAIEGKMIEIHQGGCLKCRDCRGRGQ